MYLLSTMHFYSFLMRIYIHVDDMHMQKYYNLTFPLWKKNKIWKCTSHMKMYARPNFIAYTTKIPVVLILWTPVFTEVDLGRQLFWSFTSSLLNTQLFFTIQFWVGKKLSSMNPETNIHTYVNKAPSITSGRNT